MDAALYETAPKVEYDTDLYYWDKKEVLLNQTGFEIVHFTGVGDGNKFMPESMLSELRKRKRHVETKLPEKIPACRAPLKRGGLCPRRDLRRCPIHGPIVPRDDEGEPLDAPKPTQPRAPWQEAEEEVRKALDMQAALAKLEQKGKTKRRKKDQGNLIDVNSKAEGNMAKLQKLMDGKAMRERTERVDEIERDLKMRDRKVNQW
ncbi:hypothetical protein HK097_006097 [Rhizophlyctis rosea]|uniref:UV-stimulated scaffold protein A C-terminal domain-containing protein n=1 Tax=Rhizophlyctis rosea TaxID=64517 RepID=A0AAD5SF24_9FUNG|nr:hypothetical protein HK097_006097 [Rhizophlyctis rosea]